MEKLRLLCNSEGYCWAGNAYFADLYKMSIRNISRLISQLNNKGYIKVVVINEFERKIYLSMQPTTKMSYPTTKMYMGVGQNCLGGKTKMSNPPTTKMSTRIIHLLILQLILQVIKKINKKESFVRIRK